MKNDLILREPELSFDSIHQELNNFLRDTFMENAFSHPLSMKKNLTWRPAVEVKQNEKEYKIKVQLPGVDKDNIQVDVDNEHITISAEIEEEKETKLDGEMTHTSELRYGKFVRTISFENPVKSEDSSANYKNGILNIILPKQKIEKNTVKKLKVN